MENWKIIFNTYRVVPIENDSDLLYQVGTTVGGNPVSRAQFDAIVNSIKVGLRLEKDDSLLDLCCGNGIITFELAKRVKMVTGVDGSTPYIANARAFKNADNIRYVLGDVVNVETWKEELLGSRANKVLLYASLAYLAPVDFGRILSELKVITESDTVIMIGSILDAKRKLNFFNTFKRRMIYLFKYRLLGKDAGVGRWWTRHEIETIAKKNGYTCEFIHQNPVIHTAHYRFDVILTRTA